MSSTALPFAKTEHDLAARTLRGLGRVRVVVEALARALRHRQEVKELLELDDRALQDIGLRRGEVASALAGPFGHDPSIWLREVAREREARLWAYADLARSEEAGRRRRT